MEIWLEYVSFTIGYMVEPDGSIEKVRTVFERALMAAGLHVPKGALLWESYREFENIVLAGLVCFQFFYSPCHIFTLNFVVVVWCTAIIFFNLIYRYQIVKEKTPFLQIS